MLDTAVPQCDAQQKGTKSEKEQQDHGNTSGNRSEEQQQTGKVLLLCCYTIAICEVLHFSDVLKLQS